MAVSKSQKSLSKKLKKQLRILQKKEKQSRNKLKTALKRINKLGKSYKSKLASKIRAMKKKVSEAQSTTYAKAAEDIQRKLIKNIEDKSKLLKSVITKLEKKSISKLSKSLGKKGKKIGKKKTAKSKKSSPKLQTKRRSVRRGGRGRSRRKTK